MEYLQNSNLDIGGLGPPLKFKKIDDDILAFYEVYSTFQRIIHHISKLSFFMLVNEVQKVSYSENLTDILVQFVPVRQEILYLTEHPEEAHDIWTLEDVSRQSDIWRITKLNRIQIILTRENFLI